MKNAATAAKLFILLTLLTGLAYPLAVCAAARWLAPQKAAGELVETGGQIKGSALLAQKFVRPEYFHPRPSAVDYNPMPSGGSNLSMTSRQLLDSIKERSAALGREAAADMVFASGSGLDPHISPQAALAQCERVAKARGKAEVDIISLVGTYTENRQFGVLGEPRVNVLKLNLALDGRHGNAKR